MSADKAELLGLIGLRALAVRDPFEYRRVADLPIPELDQRIEVLLDSVPDDDCRRLYDQVIKIGSQPDADVLLDEVVESSFRKAQFEAMELEIAPHSVAESDIATVNAKSDSQLSNPGAIIAYELERANLKWTSRDISEVMPFRFDEDFRVIESEGDGGTFLAALGSVAKSLSDPNLVVGSESTRKSAIWRICKRILQTKGLTLRKAANKKDLFSAAQRGGAGEWLANNLKEPSNSEIPKP